MGEDLEADEDIAFKNASFIWNDDENPVLKNLSLSIKRGELVAVVGSVAAGKSSLIQAIIGELNPSAGTISRRKSVSLSSTVLPSEAVLENSMPLAPV